MASLAAADAWRWMAAERVYFFLVVLSGIVGGVREEESRVTGYTVSYCPTMSCIYFGAQFSRQN